MKFSLCIEIVFVNLRLLVKGASKDMDVIREADELYIHNEVELLYNHLKPFVDSSNADLLWRLARATCDKAKSTTDASLKKELMYEALSHAERAIKLGEDNFACHKVRKKKMFSNNIIINVNCKQYIVNNV